MYIIFAELFIFALCLKKDLFLREKCNYWSMFVIDCLVKKKLHENLDCFTVKDQQRLSMKK